MRERERIQQLRQANPSGVMFCSQPSFGEAAVQSSPRSLPSPPALVTIDRYSPVPPPIFKPYYTDYDYDFKGYFPPVPAPRMGLCRSQIVFPTACSCLTPTAFSTVNSHRNSVAVAVIKNRYGF